MSFWKGKQVLVTGANGFAGSHLCRELILAGAYVKAFVRRGGSVLNLEDIKDKIEFVLGDVTDLTTTLKATSDVDIIFHLAAVVPVIEARNVPQNTLEVNVIGTFNVAWCGMKNNVKRMVHVSTCHVYGNQPESLLPLKESTIPNPNDIYSASKYAAEIVLKPLINEGFDVVITRAFNHFGPYQTGDFFVPKVITQLLKGQNPVLGNPNTTRDYSYVTDIVRGYMLAAEKGKKGEIYHFCSGKEISMGELCNKILEIAKNEFGINSNLKPIWNSSRSLDIYRSYGDYSKAKKELGWEPEISLEEGIRLTIKWWKSQLY
jgi:nucleoside-diphosphate-sugar epimerase